MTKQKHVVFAWELGANYGHLTKIVSLSHHLLQSGFKISYVIKDLSYLLKLNVPSNIDIYQAPNWPLEGSASKLIVSFSDILWNIGYKNDEKLFGMIKGWHQILDLIKPDLLICNHSPTAALVGRFFDFPVSYYGTGFEIPSIQYPMASIRQWEHVTLNQLKKSDQKTLKVINQTLEKLSQPALKNVAEIFEVEKTFLCTLPEIDPYQQRGDIPYWGPIMEVGQGIEPYWNRKKQKKIFVYMNPTFKVNERIFQAIGNQDCFVNAHFSGGVVPEYLQNKPYDNVNVSTKPFNMSVVMQETDLLICQSSHAMACVGLLFGKPMLLVPSQQEQKLTTMNLVKIGIAEEVGLQDTVAIIAQKIDKVLFHPNYENNAQFMQDKYKSFELNKQVGLIAEECKELLH